MTTKSAKKQQSNENSLDTRPGGPANDNAKGWPTLASLSLEQKIAQLLCPFFSTHRLKREERTALETFVQTHGIGHIHVGKGSFAKTRGWIEHFQALSISATGLPVTMTADCEHGLPHTFRCGSEFPWQMAIGASQSLESARKMGQLLGEEARALGIDVVFGPCVDVNTNPLNKAIASRAFGGSPDDVAAMGVSFAAGLESSGVIATLKHFPGHGSATEDSHLTLPEDPSPEALFSSIHLPPFRVGIEAGVKAIMTGHLYVPALDEANVTTVSHKIMTGLLRDTLGFSGVLFTDSLNMNAIHYGRSKRKAALDSLLAGCDVLVHPAQADRIEGIWEYLLQAVERGVLSEERVDQAVGRILRLKQAIRPHQQMPSQGRAEAMFQAPARIDQIKALAHDGVTLVSPLPYNPLDRKQLALEGFESEEVPTNQRISLVIAVDSDRKKDIPTVLPDACQAFAPQCKSFVITEESSLLDVAILHHQIAEREGPVILAVYSPMTRFKSGSMLSDDLCHKLERLGEGIEIHTCIAFGSPYILLDLPGTQRLCAYGPAAPSERVAAEILFGRREPGHYLPVVWPQEAELASTSKNIERAA